MKIEIEKPVVPAWFDKWYKTFNGDKTHALYHLNRVGWGYALTDRDDSEIDYFGDKLHDLSSDSSSFKSAKDYLSKAILFGYEVDREPRYYAKIKGWKISSDDEVYWNYTPQSTRGNNDEIFVSDNTPIGSTKVKLTKDYWILLGINDSNADFEEVE